MGIFAGLSLDRQPQLGLLESRERAWSLEGCFHYMAPLWACLCIDHNRHFREEQMLGSSSSMGKKASESGIKGSTFAVSFVTQGSSPLSDPSAQRHPYWRIIKKRAGGSPGQTPHLAATALRRLAWYNTFFPSSPAHTPTCDHASPLPCSPALDQAQEKLAGAPGASYPSCNLPPPKGMPVAQLLGSLAKKASRGPEGSREHI